MPRMCSYNISSQWTHWYLYIIISDTLLLCLQEHNTHERHLAKALYNSFTQMVVPSNSRKGYTFWHNYFSEQSENIKYLFIYISLMIWCDVCVCMVTTLSLMALWSVPLSLCTVTRTLQGVNTWTLTTLHCVSEPQSSRCNVGGCVQWWSILDFHTVKYQQIKMTFSWLPQMQFCIICCFTSNHKDTPYVLYMNHVET